MATSQRLYLLLLVFLAFCLSGNGVYAFGAGKIPRCVADQSNSSFSSSYNNPCSYGHLKGKAFRHGDIVGVPDFLLNDGTQPLPQEEAIGDLFKRHGVKVGLFGSLMGKHKFSPMDIKRIYFG